MADKPGMSSPRSCGFAFQSFVKVVYTTNVVESVHYQLRKVTKTRGHFPTDQSALKLLRLAARNITNKRGGNLGTGTHGWKTALNQLEIHFPNRLNLTH